MKFRYEKLRKFCSTCGMLTHEYSSKYPMKNDVPPPPPEDDDDDEDHDYNLDAPVRNQTDDTQGQSDKHVTDSGKKEDSPAASKKRKREPSTSKDHNHVFPLVCWDMRQTRALEDTEHQVFKRQRRQSETLEIRNWFLMQPQTSIQSPDAGRSALPTPTTNRDGTVDQKPLEPQ